jgi:hypothetical protein
MGRKSRYPGVHRFAVGAAKKGVYMDARFALL